MRENFIFLSAFQKELKWFATVVTVASHVVEPAPTRLFVLPDNLTTCLRHAVCMVGAAVVEAVVEAVVAAAVHPPKWPVPAP